MKLARATLAVALCGSLLVAATAEAKIAPKLPCKMVTDPADDAGISDSTGNDEALDILSFDMASTEKKVTFVWRVKKASLKSSVLPAGGVQWDAAFDWNDHHLLASVASDGAKATGIFSESATGNNDVISFTDAVVDTAKNEVRMTVPAIDFPDRFKLGMVFSAFELSSANGKIVLSTGVVDGSGGGLWGDTTDVSAKTYRAGAKNCVVVK